jgi:hypothetical protein
MGAASLLPIDNDTDDCVVGATDGGDGGAVRTDAHPTRRHDSHAHASLALPMSFLPIMIFI